MTIYPRIHIQFFGGSCLFLVLSSDNLNSNNTSILRIESAFKNFNFQEKWILVSYWKPFSSKRKCVLRSCTKMVTWSKIYDFFLNEYDLNWLEFLSEISRGDREQLKVHLSGQNIFTFKKKKIFKNFLFHEIYSRKIYWFWALIHALNYREINKIKWTDSKTDTYLQSTCNTFKL